jgi:heme exporter protein A
MLEAIDLAARRGSSRLFSQLSFTVEPGCALFVTGANGTGKTTLLRILAGLGSPSAGKVRWRGVDVAPFAQGLRDDVAYGGHLAALKDELTAEENLALLVALTGEAVDATRLRDALAGVSLERQARLPARALSQGQRRRLGLARLSLSRRPLWLLDEPATALDAAGIALLKRLLTAHLEHGGSALVATHQALDLPAAHSRALSLS